MFKGWSIQNIVATVGTATIGLILAGLSVWLDLTVGASVFTAWQSAGWYKVTGQVVSSTVTTTANSNGSSSSMPVVTYNFMGPFLSHRQSASNVFVNEPWDLNVGKATAIAAAYSPGTTVDVWTDGDSKSALIPGMATHDRLNLLYLLLPNILSLFPCLWVLKLIFRRKSPGGLKFTVKGARVIVRVQRINPWAVACIIQFFLAFFIAFGATLSSAPSLPGLVAAVAVPPVVSLLVGWMIATAYDQPVRQLVVDLSARMITVPNWRFGHESRTIAFDDVAKLGVVHRTIKAGTEEKELVCLAIVDHEGLESIACRHFIPSRVEELADWLLSKIQSTSHPAPTPVDANPT